MTIQKVVEPTTKARLGPSEEDHVCKYMSLALCKVEGDKGLFVIKQIFMRDILFVLKIHSH